MPWVKFDDRFPISRKVAPLSDTAYRLHTEAIFWCARELTDGHVPADQLWYVSLVKRAEKHVGELVTRGLWEPVDDGWRIHDYLDYQPSKADVLSERERKAAAGRVGGVRSGRTRRAKAEAKQAASPNEANGKQSGSEVPNSRTRTRPDPPPSQREGGSGAALRADARGAPTPPPDDSITHRLTGSPDYDAIARNAVRGDRRAQLAELARAALRNPTDEETPDA